MHAVLAPKVAGADNLDRATRASALDYFVAFSSVTTMIGNPGQGAYVAANGYLQGLMRRRRAEGLPAWPSGWGAIADVGILARDPAARRRSSGGLPASSPCRRAMALAHLETLLAGRRAARPTVYCATLRPGEMLQRLKVLQTPTFAALFAGGERRRGPRKWIWRRSVAGQERRRGARAGRGGLWPPKWRASLALPPEEIELTRPLDELGMDSMMGLDLRMSIEKSFGVELPVVAITAGVSVNDLAGRADRGLRSGAAARQDDADLRVDAAARHGAIVDVGRR